MEQKLRRDRYMGENLRRLRDNADISQEKLCAELQSMHLQIYRACRRLQYTVCLDNTIRVQCFFEETAPLSALFPSAHNTSVFLGRAPCR